MNSPDRNNAIRGHRNMSGEHFIACDAENKTIRNNKKTTSKTKRNAFTNNLLSELQ